MKATELRIGNWVLNHKGEIETVKAIGMNGYIWFDKERNLIDRLCQPIPLTEEWLVKFGLNQLSNNKASWYGETNDMKMFIFVPENDFYSSMLYVHKWDDTFYFAISTLDDGMESFERLAKIEYVHQFQNLYFALTNEELTIIS